MSMRCERCGSKNITTNITSDRNFSVGKAFVGTALFGPGGAVMGAKNGKEQTTTWRICQNCGHVSEFTLINAIEIDKAIEENDIDKLTRFKILYPGIEWVERPCSPINTQDELNSKLNMKELGNEFFCHIQAKSPGSLKFFRTNELFSKNDDFYHILKVEVTSTLGLGSSITDIDDQINRLVMAFIRELVNDGSLFKIVTNRKIALYCCADMLEEHIFSTLKKASLPPIMSRSDIPSLLKGIDETLATEPDKFLTSLINAKCLSQIHIDTEDYFINTRYFFAYLSNIGFCEFNLPSKENLENFLRISNYILAHEPAESPNAQKALELLPKIQSTIVNFEKHRMYFDLFSSFLSKNKEWASSPDTVGEFVDSLFLPDDFTLDWNTTEKENIPNWYQLNKMHFLAFCHPCNIIVSENNPDFCTVDGVLYSKDKHELICYPCGRKEQIVIPDFVTKIGTRAFQYYNGTKSLDIPNNVKIIDRFPFAKASFEKISIPNSIADLSASTFSFADNLIEIQIEESNSYFVIEDDVIYTKDKKVLLYCPPHKAGVFEIPEGVVTIAAAAFRDCTQLSHIYISNKVSRIEEAAFLRCSSLQSITIPDTINKIPNLAFAMCKSLTCVSIPNSIIEIGKSAFNGCCSLIRLDLPHTATLLESVCSGCTSLTEIHMPNQSSIPFGTFRGCTSLITIQLPSSIAKIEDYAFSNCSSLSEIVFDGTSIDIGKHVFAGCSSLKRLTLPPSSEISAYSFKNSEIEILELPREATKFELKEKFIYDQIPLKTLLGPENILNLFQKSLPASFRKQCKILTYEAIERKQKIEEENRIREAEEALKQQRRSQLLCQHCGGQFKGLFSKTCVACGKKKDY